MENEKTEKIQKTEKRVWQSPEVKDLDVDKTASGTIGTSKEGKYSAS